DAPESREGQTAASIAILDERGGRALPFSYLCRASACVLRKRRRRGQRVRTQDHPVHRLEGGLLLSPRETRISRELEGVDLHRRQLRERVAPCVRYRVLQQVEKRMARGVRRRQRIGPAAVTRDA